MTAIDGYIFNDAAYSFYESRANSNYSIARSGEVILDAGTLYHSGRIASYVAKKRDGRVFPPENIAGATTYYVLAATDVGAESSRRRWVSTTINFLDAPAAEGTYDAGSLVILSSWT